MAAGTIAQINSHPCYLKSFYQRLKRRRGALRAQVAVQHKILTAVWHMLTHDVPYHELGSDYFEHRPQGTRRRASQARRLLAELQQDGYNVTDLLPAHAA
jgi:hypothetical protein